MSHYHFIPRSPDPLIKNDQDAYTAKLGHLNHLSYLLEKKFTEQSSYLTEEIDTGGIWIDGKKIYRLVVTGTVPNLKDIYETFVMQSNGVNVPKLENIITFHASVNPKNYNLVIPLGGISSLDIEFDIYYSYDGDIPHLLVNFYSADPLIPDATFIAVLEYTRIHND